MRAPPIIESAKTSHPFNCMTNLIHPSINKLEAYQTVPFFGPVKLDAMESPYGIPSALQADFKAALSQVDVNRYPDPGAAELKDRLRSVFRVPARYAMTLGNGSDELLQLIQLAVGGYGRTIMAPQPSFAMYEIIAHYTRAEYIGVDLDGRFQLSESDWLKALEEHQPACVFFAYPNNPTGHFFDDQLIEQTASASNTLVVADEAYFAYSRRSMLAAMDRHENMVVVRTLSKSGLAGLRLGYMISHPAWGEQLEKLRMPYNVGALNQAAASFALEHWDEFCRATQVVIDERQRLSIALKALEGPKVYATETNLILVQGMKSGAAKAL